MIKFSRQLRYDIQTGTFLSWKEGLFFIFFSILIIFTMYPTMKANATVKHLSLSWIDYLCGFFMGMHKFQTADRTVHFDIPIAWFFVQVGYYLTIAKYPLTDYRERGYQFIIRSGNKRYWWYSKCIWICIHTLFYYGILYLVCIGAALFTGNDVFGIGADAWGLGINRLGLAQEIVTLFVVPILIAIASGMVEMFFSFLWNPLVALISLLVVCVSSAYWCNPFLPGNYTMLLRNKWLFPSYNINVGLGLLYASVIGVVAAIAGYQYFCRQDMIERK